MITCLKAWILFNAFVVNSHLHLLLWASSFKDDTRPALSKLRFLKSLWSKKSNASHTLHGIMGKTKTPQSLRRREHTSKNEQTFPGQDILKFFSEDFRTEWCRIHQAKLDWNKYLAPCDKYTRWGIRHAGWRNKKLKTCAGNSYISKWDIRPAGEFSKFFIQSKTSSNHSKHIGGDSWRIHVKGASSVSATVFDHNNGIYEVVFLLMEAGLYQIDINLDYTLCDGFKDPPVHWYKKGCTQGKNQPDGTLQGDRPYLMEPFGDGKCISIKVPEPKYSKKIITAMDKIRKKIFTRGTQTKCDVGCSSLISDGLGRWINGTWKPFFQDKDLKREPHNHEGVLWIFGDSVSKRFEEYLENDARDDKICTKIFKQCKTTYTWIYNVKNENEVTVNGEDFNHQRVMNEFNKVLGEKILDEYSVILLNRGIHFVFAVNFSNYKRLIDDFIKTIRIKRMKGQFKGKIIWRTTTAIFKERSLYPDKDFVRFLTFPRIILYNAYAMSAMCRAGIDVIDVYPMTDSFPPGTISKNDALHYDMRALENLAVLLYYKFKPS